MTDAELARSVAIEAGELLKSIRASSGLEGKALGAMGDRDANTLILERLRAARPDDFILSEESVDDRARCAASRVWIVDPLDGTREYASGSTEWAVHIGLAVDGRPRWARCRCPIAIRSSRPTTCLPHIPCPAGLRVVVSRSRAPDIAHCVGDRLGAIMIPMGSAGAKAMAVVEGRADVYLHDGGQYEWDNCAPAAVALAAGLHASRIDGSPLVYNCRDPLLPDLLICRKEVAAIVLEAIARG